LYLLLIFHAGELAISCRATGLLMSLSFAKGCSVKGTIEQLPGSTTAAAAAMAAAAAGTGGKAQLLGTVVGHWTSVINVSCPKLVSAAHHICSAYVLFVCLSMLVAAFLAALTPLLLHARCGA
jgi:hypothetical protein